MKLKHLFVSVFLLAGIALSHSASAQLQYYGYVAGSDDASLNGLSSYTNFGYVSTLEDELTVPRVRYRIDAMAQRNMKAVIELGLLLWCDPGNSYRTLCPNWEARWDA